MDRLATCTESELGALAVSGGVLRWKDYNRLRPDKWLNDEVINDRLSILQRTNGPLAAEGKSVKVHIFNSFFMQKLWLNEHRTLQLRAVETYSRPRALNMAGQLEGSIFDCQLWIVPCHLPNHWVLLVVDLSARTLTYYDPLGVSLMIDSWTSCEGILHVCRLRCGRWQLQPLVYAQ